MQNILLSNQLLYKKVKQYKNLESHWIGGELISIKNIILDKRYVNLNFYNENNTNNSKISNQLLTYKNFIKNKFIYYDKHFKKLIFNDMIYVWYENEKTLLIKPIQYNYLKKNYIYFKYKNNKNLFKKIEQKRIFTLLKKRKLYFLYNNIWVKIYKHKYNKNIIKQLFINFIKKQNIHFFFKKISKDKIKLKSILLGFYNKDIIIYTPKLFKISVISYHLINKKINKLIIKHWKSLKKLNIKKKVIKTYFYKFIIYNIFYIIYTK